jgi:hypothetical protein
MKRMAGKTGLMVEYELRMFWSTLRLNIKKPTYILSHVALLLTCLFIGYSFALAPEYFILGGYSQVVAESETVVFDMLTVLFALLLLYTVLRGLFDQGLRSYVGQADFNVLVLTPIDSRCIVMAKFVRNLISRPFFIVLAFLVIAPISLKLGTPPLLLAAALASLTLYIEFLQTTSHAVHSAREAFRSRLSSRARQSIKLTALTVSAIVLLMAVLSDYYAIGPWIRVFNEGAETFWTVLPSSLTASLLLGFILGRVEVAYPSLLYLSGFLTGALAFMYAASGPYHPEEFAPHLFPPDIRNPLGFRIGRLIESRLSWEKHSLIIFLKDFQLALRGALVDFSLLDFTIMYAVPLASWYLLESFLPVQIIPNLETKLGPFKVFVMELVFLFALLPFIPSLTSFSREMGRVWLLKAFPFQNRAVTYGKFLFALVISAASLTPMALVAGLAFEIQPSEWIIVAVLPLVLLIANSFGVLVGAYMPPYDLDNRVSLKSIITFFLFLMIVLTPFTFIASVQGNIGQVIVLAVLALYSAASMMFFLGQAGKGFEKLELKEILPFEAESVLTDENRDS